MSTLPKSRIRIAGDLFRFNRLSDILRPSETNAYEEEIPVWPRFRSADSLQIEVGLFENGILLTDLSSITRLRLTIKPLLPAVTETDMPVGADPDSLRGPASNIAPIAAQTVESAAFNATLTQQQWQSNNADKAHAIITLSSAQAALEPGQRWLSLIAEDHAGETRTLAAGPVVILGGGATLNALPQPLVEDLRDQAAQSAAQAAQSAGNANTASQQAQNAASAAQAQAQNADTAASNAGTSATEAAQITIAAGTHATDAQAAAASANAASAAAMAQAAQAQAHRQAAQDASQTAQDAAQIAQASNNAQAAHSAALALEYRDQAQLAAGQTESDRQLAEEAASLAAVFAEGLSPAGYAPAGGVIFDGSNGYALSDASINLADATHCISAVVTPQQSSAFHLLSQGGVTSGWYISIGSGLSLVLKNGDGTNDFLSVNFSVAFTPHVSRHIALVINILAAQPRIDLYIDGQLIDSQTPATSGSYQHSAARLCIGALEEGSHAPTSGSASRIIIFNRTLRIDEIAQLAAVGGDSVAHPDRITDTSAPVADNFSSATPVGISTTRLSAAGNVGPISDGSKTVSNPLRLSATAVSGSHSCVFNAASGTNSITALICNEITFDYYIPSSNNTARGLRCFYSAGSAGITPLEGSTVLSVRGSWEKARIVMLPQQQFNGSRLLIFMLNASAENSFTGNPSEHIYISNVRIRQVGAIAHLPMQEGCGYQSRDHSVFANDLMLSATGTNRRTSGTRFTLRLSRVSSGFLANADRPVLPDGSIIEEIIWEDSKSVRTRASLGFNAANTQTHVAAWTPSQSRQHATLNSQSLVTADRRLYLHMLDNPGAVTLCIKGRIL